jgi:hypothetical protein
VRDGRAWDLRGLLLLIVLVGAAGLVAELLLLEHYEEWTQWLPLAVLGGVVISATLVWLRPVPATLLSFRALMTIALATGIAGLVLHYTGNREFELERDGALGGWPLVWESLRGATPALAPGALIQLALIGLAFTWRHPGLTRDNHDEMER